jgi:hypothetical protein
MRFGIADADLMPSFGAAVQRTLTGVCRRCQQQGGDQRFRRTLRSTSRATIMTI